MCTVRAIARSLQEGSSQTAPRRPRAASPEIIEIDDDDEDNDHGIRQKQDDSTVGGNEDEEDAQFQADLRRAMEASKTEAARSMAPSNPATSGPSTRDGSSSVQEVTPQPPTRPGSAFLFDRAQMERERLERQKRLRPDIVQNSSGTIEEEGEEDSAEDVRSAKRQRVSSSSAMPTRTNVASFSSRTASPAAGMSRAATGADAGDGLYFDGELRQTANKHVSAAKDTRPMFRLTDVLAPVSPAHH